MDKDKLIEKYFRGESSAEELNQLYDWINESDKNRKMFADLKNGEALLASKLAPDNSSADFDSLLVKLPRYQQNKFSLRKFYSIAAAILFPVFLLISAGLIYSQYSIVQEINYTEVIAPPKHNSQVKLADGTQVWLSPESKLIYAQNFGEENRIVQLIGEGYFEVVHNEKKPFVVQTHELQIKVLGTSFNVEAYPEDKIIRTTLVRGSVEIESDKLNNEILLKPGDRVSLNTVTKNITVEKVNTEIYRLIKDGLLIFKRNNLNEVCRKLERWFMIPIEYDGEGNQNLLFTAKFEDESIQQILKIVSETIPINYQIRNDKIIIRYKN